MSRKKLIIWVLFVLLVGGVAAVTGQEERDDPVLRYYTERAAGQGESRDPYKAGLAFQAWVRAYLTHLGRGGKDELTDSATFIRYYSFGELDSQAVTAVTKEALIEIDLTYPNIFSQDYDFRFYPNDTGGAVLPIGFESDTVRNLSPVGLAVIDRDEYYLRKLYLYYPKLEKYERYSRTLSFGLHDGFVFPDTAVTTYAQAGIFSVEHYRIDAYVDSVKIIRGGDSE